MPGKKVSDFRTRFCELIDSSPKSRTVIAQEFGVAKQTISAWITGQSSPRMPVVTALAEYFDVNIDWLLGFDVPKYIENSPLVKPPDSEPIKTIEARIISGGIDKMPKERREQALKILQVAFAEYSDYFKEDPDNDA